jgi:hypothetical protein
MGIINRVLLCFNEKFHCIKNNFGFLGFYLPGYHLHFDHMTKKILFVMSMSLLAMHLTAQEHDHHEAMDHEHHHAHEIGVSVSPVYFTKAEELSLSTHFHYTYNFPQTRFGLGVGYERIFDEHKHNFIGAEFSYRLVHPLSISLSPGIAFEGEHPDEKQFALHVESVYEFELGAFHLGPSLEMAYHPEDFHISLGLHIGLGF